jgi:hypothetical protein
MQSHDHNFKNVFLDFPREALTWLLPEALREYGELHRIEFVRQEPGKRKLTDRGLELDMPILFTFDAGQILLWVVEFQEDKRKFSIYRLLRYVTDLMERHPSATVIPTVLFTARRRWKKDVLRQLSSRLGDRVFLHFEFQLIRLFDYQARDYYNSSNPLLKILLPKMDFNEEDRLEVIRQAYKGLYELVAPMVFDKYLDFIDMYAGIAEDEKETVYCDLREHKETAMLAQYIKSKGFEEGMQQGMQQGVQQGVQQGKHGLLERILVSRFGPLPDWAKRKLDSASPEQLEQWADCVLKAESLRGILSE